MLLRLHIPKSLTKWKPIAFAQKDKSHGGTNENPWKSARSFQWRHIASITSSFHLGRTSQMLVAELRKDASKPFGHEIS